MLAYVGNFYWALKKMQHHKYFAVITGLFCACLVISNILDTKLFQIGDMVFPSGIILFPIVYVFGDIFTEVYGYAQSRKAIWAGFISLVLLILSLEISRRLPAASFWPNQPAFDIIFDKVPRIVIASISAYFAGEFVNSYVVAKLKLRQAGKAMPVRFIASTLAGQAVDTFLFVMIAFFGTMQFIMLLKIFISGWLFKVLWEIIALPISITIVTWLKKSENEDYYDTHTNFNPFKIAE